MIISILIYARILSHPSKMQMGVISVTVIGIKEYLLIYWINNNSIKSNRKQMPVIFNQTFSADKQIYYPSNWESGKTADQLYEEFQQTITYWIIINLVH